jgi:hypothetical protein
VALAVLAAIITLAFADILLGLNVLFVRDVSAYYYPAKHVVREILLGGEIPYWNPYFGAGQPLAANPEHEVFYPLTWLVLLPSYRIGFHLLTLIHLYIAAAAMFALLRSMGRSAAAAFFGALSFAIGGISLSYLNLQPCLFAVAWLPLIALYTRRFLRHRSRRDLALACLFFGIQLLVGEPSTILQTGLLLGFYALYAGWRRGRVRGAALAVAMVGLISVGALLVGAVQILPTLDFAAGSVRARGLPFEAVSNWSTPPVRIFELLHPNFLGHIDVLGQSLYWGSPLYGVRHSPYLFTIYPGLLVSILAIAGFFARVRGWPFVLAVSGFSFLLALGENTPLWRLLYDLGFRAIRYPEKFLLLLLVAWIVFGAKALDALLDGDARARKSALWTAGAFTGIAALAVLLSRTPIHEALFEWLWSPSPSRIHDMLAAAAVGWLAAAARGGAVLLLVRNAGGARRRVWLALAGAFMVLDLGMVMIETVPRLPKQYYDPPELVRTFPANRAPFRLFHHADLHKLKPATQPYFRDHPDSYWVTRNALFPMRPAQHGIRMVMDTDFDMTSLQPTADFVQSIADLSDRRRDWVDLMASMSNVWFQASFRDPKEAFARARGDRRILQPVGLLALEKNPRYFFAERVETIADRVDFVSKLASPRYVEWTAFVHAAPFRPAPGRVLRVSETANSACLDVETSGRAFLVISITPHKYWRVTIDGIGAKAIVTNVGYQGVIVPDAGRHVVEMRYSNPLVAVGGAISAAALLALAFVAITMRAL